MDNNEIIKAIQNNISKKLQSDPKLRKAYEAVRDGKGTNKQLYAFQELLADATNMAIAEEITEEKLTDDLIGSIGAVIVAPVLLNGHKQLINIADAMERVKLERIKVGFKPIKTEATETRIKDIASKYNEVTTASELKLLSAEKGINQFYGASLDEFIEANASFQYEAGLVPTLIRSTTGDCCEYCNSLAGEYPYDGTPGCGTGENLFARHKGCNCVIEVRTVRGGNLTRVNNRRR